MEVVGVVADFMTGGEDIQPPAMFTAVTLDQLPMPLSLAIRVRAKPVTAFTPRLREIAAGVDPTLQLNGLQSATEAERERKRGLGLIALATVGATGSVLLLSAAGIYAMMSFSVVRRRREIGIRSALGANARHLLTSIFARASVQLAAGMTIGLLGALAIGPAMGADSFISERGVVVFPIVAGVLTLVGLLGALGPARQGLSIQPTEALREE
jgi:cell division protein FtsX